MDTAEFLRRLPEIYEHSDVRGGAPVDPIFDEIAADVSGFTTPKVLALLNLAVSLLGGDEAYLEVGTFKGRSLAGAMHAASERSRAAHFYAVENLLEFGMLGADARAELERNVGRWADAERLTFVEGDSFDVLDDGRTVKHPVGVYFYDGAHTSLTHYLALALAEPLLADEALVLVDDAAWPLVRRATEAYIRSRPQWRVLHELRPLRDDDPDWANGLMMLEYRRAGASPAPRTRDVAWRLAAYRRVERPASTAAWRFVDSHPGVVPALKRLVPTRGRRVRQGT